VSAPGSCASISTPRAGWPRSTGCLGRGPGRVPSHARC
jgi:hypothetical protein